MLLGLLRQGNATSLFSWANKGVARELVTLLQEAQQRLNARLKAGLMDEGSRVLAYKQKAPAPRSGYVNSLKVLYTAHHGKDTVRKGKSTRHIPSAPSRVLDAPDLLDDYYLNLTSWGANNCVAVALGPTVYVWNAGTGAINELLTDRKSVV